MKQRLIVLFFLLFITASVIGQVAINASLADSVPVNAQIPFVVKISKGSVTELSKYQIDVPNNVIVKLTESRGGTFTFENNSAKIIWAKTPAASQLVIKLVLFSGNETGVKKISQKYEYMQDGEHKEAEAEPLNIVFIKNKADSVATGTQSVNRGEASQKAAQLRKDSKEAYKVGKTEEEAANQKIAEANEEIKKANKIKDSTERRTVMTKANEKKEKAEFDKSVAAKILALAKSLDDNAKEIETMTKSSAANNSVTTSAANDTTSISKSDNLENTGVIYYVQIGAFSQNPKEALSQHLNAIKIVQESNMYKVLYGKYNTKEEALKQRLEMLNRGFVDCFVVTYKDGLRVK